MSGIVEQLVDQLPALVGVLFAGGLGAFMGRAVMARKIERQSIAEVATSHSMHVGERVRELEKRLETVQSELLFEVRERAKVQSDADRFDKELLSEKTKRRNLEVRVATMEAERQRMRDYTEARFEQLIELSHLPILRVNADTGVVAWQNASSVTLLGNRVGTSFAVWTHPADIEVDLSLLREVRLQRRKSYQLPKRWEHPRFALPGSGSPNPNEPADWVAGLLVVTVWHQVPGAEVVDNVMAQVVPIRSDYDVDWGTPLPQGTNVWELFHGIGVSV